jgi:uncharacterized membrane-anchored protein
MPSGGSKAGLISALEDTANRLERSIDVQHQIITDIDRKAEHVTRLLGIVLGLLFTALSIIGQLDAISYSDAILAARIAFVGGVVLLLLSMTAAIITYLSSKYKIGLDPVVGRTFSNSNFSPTYEYHLRLVNGAYDYNVRVNREVIEENSKRFRYALYFLLVGLVFLSTAGTIHFGGMDSNVGLLVLTLAALVAGILGWYVLGGQYLTISGGDDPV